MFRLSIASANATPEGMMRTSTAEANNYICPECGDELTQDLAERGFVRHKNNPDCPLDRGEKDGEGPQTDGEDDSGPATAPLV